MKTVNTTQILQKSIDIQLKKILLGDLKAFRSVKQSNTNRLGAEKAA